MNGRESPGRVRRLASALYAESIKLHPANIDVVGQMHLQLNYAVACVRADAHKKSGERAVRALRGVY